MAFDHEAIAIAGRDRLRAKLSYTNLGFALAPATFTISELRDLYTAALGHDVSPTNSSECSYAAASSSGRDAALPTGRRSPGGALPLPHAPPRDHGSVRGAQAAAGNVTRRSTERSPVKRIALTLLVVGVALAIAVTALGATVLSDPTSPTKLAYAKKALAATAGSVTIRSKNTSAVLKHNIALRGRRRRASCSSKARSSVRTACRR